MKSVKFSFGLGLVLIGAVVVALYSGSLGHNFLFDEENIILRNPTVKDLTAVPEFFRHGFFYFKDRAVSSWKEYYRPLTLITFAMDYHFWKGNPFGYNLTNLLLHFISCGLLFAFLWRLTGRAAAFTVTLVYAAHTLHVEAVTYIASRSDLLVGAATLGTLLFYLSGRWRAALLVCAGAFFCKETAMSLPFFVLAAEWGLKKSNGRQTVSHTWPFFVLAAAYLVFRKWATPVPFGPEGLVPREVALRVLSMGDALLDYFRAAFFPERFKFTEVVSFAPAFGDLRVLRSIGIFAALIAAWFFTLRKKNTAFFGLTLFLGGLLPYLQFVHFYPEWAEHYFYLPSMGLAVLAAITLDALCVRSGKKAKVMLFTALAIFFLFVSGRTLERNRLYNEAQLFYETLSKSDSPYAFYGYQNLARLFIENGEWDKAATPLFIALKMQPHSDVTEQVLGVYFSRKQRLDLALAHFQEAVKLNPENAQCSIDAADTLMRLARPGEALVTLTAAQARNPRYAPLYRALLYAAELSGDKRAAVVWGERGVGAAGENKKEAASMRMAMLRFAYREHEEPLFKAMLERLLKEHRDTPWYGEAAMVLAGKMSPEAFCADAKTRYPGFENEAKVYAMIAYAVNGDKQALRRFFDEKPFTEEALRRPIFRKEVEAAQAALEAA